jgi:hypothetical protein
MVICNDHYMPDTNVQWILLLSQLPPKQDALRVRIWRRLQAVGAVMIRNACWCLPDTAQAAEDFQWCIQEIDSAGGEALMCRSVLVEGMTNDQVRGLFRAARDADYAALMHDSRAVLDGIGAQDRDALGRQAAKLRRSFETIVNIDHGRATGRLAAERAIAQVEKAVAQRVAPADPMTDLPQPRACRGKIWVTRADVGIDRLSSAWFIRGRIDPKARFRFVAGPTAARRSGELRFDMSEAEFTHRGDLCTFEVLLAWSGVRDPGLKRMAMIIHDLDLNDSRHQRPETAGVACTIAGITARIASDTERIAVASAFFDSLHAGLCAGSTKDIAP